MLDLDICAVSLVIIKQETKIIKNRSLNTLIYGNKITIERMFATD